MRREDRVEGGRGYLHRDSVVLNKNNSCVHIGSLQFIGAGRRRREAKGTESGRREGRRGREREEEGEEETYCFWFKQSAQVDAHQSHQECCESSNKQADY